MMEGRLGALRLLVPAGARRAVGAEPRQALGCVRRGGCPPECTCATTCRAPLPYRAPFT